MDGNATGMGIVIGALAGLFVSIVLLPSGALPAGLIVGACVGLAFGAAWDTRLEEPPHDEE